MTSLASDPPVTLFYTTNNNTYRNLEALDLRSGKSRMLLQAARIGDIVYNPADRSLWGLRLVNGLVVLVRIPFPYKVAAAVCVSLERAGLRSGSLARRFSRVGVGVRSGAEARFAAGDRGASHAYRGARQGGRHTAAHFTMGAAVPEGFVFSKDGRYLYGSSFFTGVSNIYRYEIATEQLAAVSNADVGFFRPLPHG